MIASLNQIRHKLIYNGAVTDAPGCMVCALDYVVT
jgi:hypothetical protein